jgi:hypothetical protein
MMLRRVIAFVKHATPMEIGEYRARLTARRGEVTEALAANLDPVNDPTGVYRGQMGNLMDFYALDMMLQMITEPEIGLNRTRHRNQFSVESQKAKWQKTAREVLVRRLEFWNRPRNSGKDAVRVLFESLPAGAQARSVQSFSRRLKPSARPFQRLNNYSQPRWSPETRRRRAARIAQQAAREARRRARARAAAGAAGSQGGGARLTRKNRPVAGFAVVHSAEKPWVKEPNYRRWIRKLHRHTQKVKRHGDEENPANLCVDSELCKGDLGIPRRLMPQFTSPKDIRSFISFAQKRYGIRSRRATRRAGQLRPSQEEINRERVEDVADDIRYKKLDPKVPLIVSADNYVIDGHHRWAAFKKDQPAKKMPVLLVQAPARDVLSVAATWGAKHHQF